VITASPSLKTLFYESNSVKSSIGCTIEYNMNQMLDNILVSTTITDNDYKSTIEPVSGQEIRINPFRKLFPIDSILKPNRPVYPGVKYYILRDSDHTGPNVFYDYKTTPYPSNSPRVYYPAVETAYKYWVAPAGSGINLNITYIIATATVNEAYSTGTKVVYKTTADHGFKVGNRVTISGAGASSLNLTNQLITSIPDSKTFEVLNTVASTQATGLSKTATLVNSAGTATPTKPALSNKIMVKFEKYHSLPATCTMVITYSDNTTASPSAFSVPSSGILNIYYNGTTWSSNPPFNSTQPISYPAPKEIKSIAITTPSAGSGGIIGIIEVSARWIKNISSDLVSFNIEKESTSNPEDILPVGNITANSLSLDLVKYDQSNLKVLAYNRDSAWTTTPVPNDVIYLYKNAEIKPHMRVFHSNGSVVEGSTRYDIVEQGTFYLDSFNISQFGDVSIDALDGAKYLMETVCPDLVYELTPVTSILMSLLDSIGFTNYNMNVLLNNSNVLIDKSIPVLTTWWTEDSKTVWEAVQELCRDIQMNAFFDENNILQFYTRDKIYSDQTVDWEFYYNKTGNKLPNIVTFNKKEIMSANQVKILWKVPKSSLYTQSASDLWSSDPSFLIAAGLRYDIESTTPAELVNFHLDIDSMDPYVKFETSFSYNGYFLINSEIFEYDAIEFEYEPLNSTTKIPVFVANQGEWAQYRSLSKVGSESFKPTGKFRIKRRGVFQTEKRTHKATSIDNTIWSQIVEDEWN
jgi:hypothetical protein